MNNPAERYSRWVVVSKEGPKSRSGVKWVFRCDCGTEKAVIRNDVISGRSKSCGCLSREITAMGARIWNRTHGLEKSPEYRVWVDMRRRCHDPRRPDFKNYGGRGITVCEEWRKSFKAFYRDMGPRPEGHTLDRLQNSGPYSKKNCVWASRRKQERNKRSNRIVEYKGQRMTFAEAVEAAGVNYYTAYSRVRRGWSLEEALSLLD